jgi:hypothetical protein
MVVLAGIATAAPIVYTDEAQFLAALPYAPTTEDFTADTGELLPLVDVGTSFQVADGFLKFTGNTDFHLTNLIHTSEQFTSFGVRFCQVPPGTFVGFADASFLWSRLNPSQDDFFLGVISDTPFDLMSFTHNTGSYNMAHAYYTLVPEVSSMILLAVSGILIIPALTRGPLR